MRKRASNRLKKKLIEEAKQEVKDNILLEMEQICKFFKLDKANEGEGEGDENGESQESPAPDNEGEGKAPKVQFKNFKDFCLRTKGVYYPNPVF